MFTAGDLGGLKYLKKFRRGLESENSEGARAGFLDALFRLGDRDVLSEMLGLLESSDYQARCVVSVSLERTTMDDVKTRLAIAALTKANRNPIAVAEQLITS